MKQDEAMMNKTEDFNYQSTTEQLPNKILIYSLLNAVASIIHPSVRLPSYYID